MSEITLTYVKRRVLNLMSDIGKPMTAKELSDKLGNITPNRVTREINELSNMGYWFLSDDTPDGKKWVIE